MRYKDTIGDWLSKVPFLASAAYYLKNWKTTGLKGRLTLVGTILLAIFLLLNLKKILVIGLCGAICWVLCRRVQQGALPQERKKLLCILIVAVTVVLSLAVLLERPYDGTPAYNATDYDDGYPSGYDGITYCYFCNRTGFCSVCDGDGEVHYREGSVFGTYCENCQGEGRCGACGGDGILSS